MRLTHKAEYKDKRKNREPMLKIRNKLFKFENIEELCIKMTTQPIYEKFFHNNHICKLDFTGHNAAYDFKNNCIIIYKGRGATIYSVNEYGKTWSLTKEELL